jgi:hypothetical protein
MHSSILRVLAAFTLGLSTPVGADRADVTARWSGGNKDITAAVALAGNAIFIAGTADGKLYSSIDGTAPPDVWCAYTVRLAFDTAAREHDALFCTGDNTWTRAAAATPTGEMWVVGHTHGRRMPVAGRALQPRYGGQASSEHWGDGFIFKRSREGRLAYATYLGGAGDDVVNAVIAAGVDVWVAGATTSSRLPGAVPITRPGAGIDGFVARVSETGTGPGLWIGGNGDDHVTGLARDHDALIAVGTTTSTAGMFGNTRGGVDAFVASIDPTTGSLRWLHRVGTQGDDDLTRVAVLPDGSIVAVGRTSSSRCVGTNAQSSGWLVTVSPRGVVGEVHCLGGTRGTTIIHDVAASGDAVWLTGQTDDPDFPLSTNGDGTRAVAKFRQAFVTRMNPRRGTVLESRLLGTDDWPRRYYNEGHGIATRGGILIVAGDTAGSSGGRVPSAGGDIQPTPGAYGFGRRFASHDSFLIRSAPR